MYTGSGISFLSLLHTKCQSYCTSHSFPKKKSLSEAFLKEDLGQYIHQNITKKVFYICCLNISYLEPQLLKRKLTLYIYGRVAANISVREQSWRRTKVYTHEIKKIQFPH